MPNELDFELMRRLSQTPGVSGFEDEVAAIVRDELAKYVDSVRIDKMGNVIGVKQGKKADAPKVMLLAHKDEIGLMVRQWQCRDRAFQQERLLYLPDTRIPQSNSSAFET